MPRKSVQTMAHDHKMISAKSSVTSFKNIMEEDPASTFDHFIPRKKKKVVDKVYHSTERM